MNPRLRDVLLFLGGGAGIAHQTIIADHAQTILVVSFIAMMVGAPALYRLLDRWDRR